MRLSLFVVIFLISWTAFADEFSEAFSDEGSANDILQLRGFVDFEQGSRVSEQGPAYQEGVDRDYVLANRRLRLKADKNFKKGSVYFKVDFNHDEVLQDFYIDVREARFVYHMDSMDISVGRQVTTWGVGDLIFINDLFPKNWRAHFSGRELDMIKDPADSLRLTKYFGKWTGDLVITPSFSPDTTPRGCYYEVFNPNSGDVVLNEDFCDQDLAQKPNSFALDNVEWALSLSRKIGRYNLAFYGYKGFYKSPMGVKVNPADSSLVPYHPELEVYGASFEGQLGPGVLSLETGYYNSKEDQDGDKFFIENSSFKSLVGYRMDVSSAFSVGAQWFQELMIDYNHYESAFQTSNPAAYDYRLDKMRNTFTLRLGYKAMQDTLFVNVFSYYRPEDKDAFYKIEVLKRLTNQFEVAAGANLFEGDENYKDRNFGMLQDADNVFVRLKYIF